MSYLEEEVIKQGRKIDEISADKILFLGLAQTGKSSIIRVVFEGMDPSKTSELPATVRYNREIVSMKGYRFNVYDVGGQITYLQEAFLDLRQSIFSYVKNLFFVIDSNKMDELELANNYFKRAVSNLQEYSKEAKIFVLAHKMDLINENEKETILSKINSVLELSEIPNITLYSTSIFDEKIYSLFDEILK